jgi:hypothetical protein
MKTSVRCNGVEVLAPGGDLRQGSIRCAVRASRSPSPQPSPSGRGRILASRSSNPAVWERSRAGPGCSLSLGEMAGVRGKWLPSKTSSPKRACALTRSALRNRCCVVHKLDVISAVVRLNCKVLRLAALLPALMLVGAGCGGISASKSVSPASFFLPGLLKADPPPAQSDPVLPGNEPPEELAPS